MARPREFNPDEVLADAMNVFWQHGYDAASMQVLLKGMGMTRGSLYKAFTDKKSLFLRVLKLYEAESVLSAVAVLTTGPTDGLDRIGAIFDSVVASVQNGDHRGCLLCSAAAGPAAVDAEISELVHSQLSKMQNAFGVALTQSTAHTDTEPRHIEELAALLLSLYVGLRVLVRSNAPLETIESNANGLKRIAGLS